MPASSRPNTPPLIRASDLADYGFCRRAWWLGRVKKITPVRRAALARGSRMHQQHLAQVNAGQRWRRLGWLLLALGIMVLLAGIASGL